MKGMKGTILGLGALAAAAISTVLHHGKTTVTYEPLTGAITNPLTGFAAMADYPSLAETASMVFVKITWAELEPEEGVRHRLCAAGAGGGAVENGARLGWHLVRMARRLDGCDVLVGAVL